MPPYTEDTLLQAKAEVEKGATILSTAKKFRTPFETLRWWTTNKPSHFGPGRTSFLSTQEELCIVEALKFLARCGFPFDCKDLLKLVETYIAHTKLADMENLSPNKPDRMNKRF